MAGTMGHHHALGRLPLAAVPNAEGFPVALPRYAVAACPELSRLRLIRHLLQRLGEFTTLDHPEHVAAELEVIAHLINGETAPTLYVDAPINTGDETLGSDRIVPTRLHVKVRVAVDGEVPKRFGSAAAVRVVQSYQGRGLSRGAQVHQDTIFDERELLHLDTVIIVEPAS